MKYIAVVTLSLVCVAVIGENVPLGGLGKTKPATPEIQELVDSMRGDILRKLPPGYAGGQDLLLNAHSYRQQVVAGMNYFIKIETGHMRFIHVRIYKDLDDVASVFGVQLQKSREDSIEYF
ncbi:cystatin-A-like [Ostrea edulis]|uniref:cystatin-A-like n=1 Tax=Ostrea edulis TaxID=37623 RepID=UPI0020963A81|nr:cystatin-A-like [Ostrea edulis]